MERINLPKAHWIHKTLIPKKIRDKIVDVLQNKQPEDNMHKVVFAKQIVQFTNKEQKYEVVKLRNIISPRVGEIISESVLQWLIDNDIQVDITA